jgi:hypothetical protein
MKMEYLKSRIQVIIVLLLLMEMDVVIMKIMSYLK